MRVNKKADISILNSGSLKLVNKFTYLDSSVSFTENDINMRLAMPWDSIDRLSIIWKADPPDKIKRNFFQVVLVSIRHGRWLRVWRKARHKLHKNAESYIEQILEAASLKTTAVRPPTFHPVLVV